MRPCISIWGSVRPSVRRSVRWSFHHALFLIAGIDKKQHRIIGKVETLFLDCKNLQKILKQNFKTIFLFWPSPPEEPWYCNARKLTSERRREPIVPSPKERKSSWHLAWVIWWRGAERKAPVDPTAGSSAMSRKKSRRCTDRRSSHRTKPTWHG